MRALRGPLPMCDAAVQSTFAQRESELGCVNPEFGELPAGSPTFRVFARVSDLAGSRSRRRIRTPNAGPAAATTNASRQLCDAIAAIAGGAPATTTPSSVCWKPSAAPVRAVPAASAAAA